MRLFLTGMLLVQLSIGNLAMAAGEKSLIEQLPSPTEQCAWWNTTNPSNCTLTDQSIPGNNDPWATGNNDPTWNYNGPDNGAWGGTDPNSPFSSGNWGGGSYTTPKLTFL